MNKWHFPSRGFAETEGFSNAGLAEFKGNPLQALAREICQNSLDASDGSGKPVRVEFHKETIDTKSFPGMIEMVDIIDRCNDFWKADADANTRNFLVKAKKAIQEKKIVVLRVSDYNTRGVQGAFSDKKITPWGGLVKGNSFSVKTDEKNAQGSYGIGKAAPFVTSSIQTVFYRTYDIDNVRATLGVSRLMAHEIPLNECNTGEDPVRRSVGYYGETKDNKPSVSIEALDNIYQRTEYGTDLFIPAFAFSSMDEEWIKKIIIEILENFLYSIYSGKLEVIVDKRELNRKTLPAMIKYIGNKGKNVSQFYDVIRDNSEVICEEREFYKLGSLRLRLLYKADLNKKVLVVRNSGMKIAEIANLPKGMSYVGFFEIKGDELNEFFRGMENPKHNAWEPKRHENPEKAKRFKEEVEEWVRETINSKLVEVCGAESLLDIGDCLNYKDLSEENKKDNTIEKIIDNVQETLVQVSEPQTKTFKIKDQGGTYGGSSNRLVSGTVGEDGSSIGHRHRTGKKKGIKPTGRNAYADDGGIDTAYDGTHEVDVSARIIATNNGKAKLIFSAYEDINMGEMEIVTKGENGMALQLYVKEAIGDNARAVNGHIVVSNVKANEKNHIEFSIAGNKKYAMGVKAYGN